MFYVQIDRTVRGASESRILRFAGYYSALIEYGLAVKNRATNREVHLYSDKKGPYFQLLKSTDSDLSTMNDF